MLNRVPLLGLLLAAPALLLSCSDETTAPPVDAGDPPAAFFVAVPDTVTRGAAFEVRIDAVDEGGLPADEWSGTVTIASSHGSISPSEVRLTGGTGTVQATISGYAGVVGITAGIGPVQSDPAALTVLSSDPPMRIEIVPAAALLTGAGEAQRFAARAFDASGAPTSVRVSWRTTNGATLAIDSSGLATAQELGSAQVIATAGDVESTPALVIVADVADDAVLLPDSQIVSAPVAVDPVAEYAPGWRYRVVVQGAAPAVGELVLGAGGIPLAGRVAGTRAVSGGAELTVELVPLNELFTHLVIDELIPMVELDGGGVQSSIGYGRARASRYGPSAVDFNLGPFTCKASGTVPSIDLPTPDLEITPRLGMRIRYDDGLRELVVVGELKADFAFKPVIEVEFTGEASCETELRTMTVPLNGWLSLFYGIQVPVGIGFKLDAALEVGEVGFDLTATATANAELGLLCPAGGSCTGVREFDLTRDMEFELITPDPSEDYRVELGLQPFVFARPKLGSVLTAALDFGLIDAEAGLRQSVDLAAPHRQVEDTAYSSSFDLRLLVEVKPAEDLQNGIESLGKVTGEAISAAFELLSVDDTLASSPKGTLTITPETVAPGDSTALGEMATFTVELTSVEYLGLYAVDEVELLWEQREEDADTFTLADGRPPCTTISASSGQTTFECEVDFLEEHGGEQPFHAFVHAKLFGVTLPVPLEVAVDTVEVDDCPYTPAVLLYSQTEVNAAAEQNLCDVGGLYLRDTTTTDPIVDVAPLAGIRRIGILRVLNTIQLRDFSGMDSTAIRGLRVMDNAALISFDGLGASLLQQDAQMAFEIQIKTNPVLADISALRTHFGDGTAVGANFMINEVPALTSLAGLEGVHRVYTMRITKSGIGTLAPLANLRVIETNAYITENPALTSVTLTLDTLHRGMQIEHNPALTDIDLDFAYVNPEADDVKVSDNPALETIAVHAASVASGLYIRNSPVLRTLSFTSDASEAHRLVLSHTGLSEIGTFNIRRLDHEIGGLFIDNNPNLTSISALSVLDYVGDQGINISLNPELCVPEWVHDVDVVGGYFLNENGECP